MRADAPGMAHPSQEAATFDQMFIDGMVVHHQGAVDMAKLARERAAHSEIKVMAESVIGSQEEEIATMKGWRAEWFVREDAPSMTMPMTRPDMRGMSPGMMTPEEMEALKAAVPFDLAFLDAMIPHHEGAVEMARHAIDKADHAEIRELATRIARDQTSEIAQMREWRKAWYPTAPALRGQM